MRLNTTFTLDNQDDVDVSQNYLTLDLIRIILIEELGIDSDRVIIYNQKFDLKRKAGLYIYIEYKSPPQMISSRNSFVNVDTNDANEEQNSNWLENISIGIYSRNLEALQRKEEVAMALHSIYSQQIQESNSFRIFRNVQIIPINDIEGTARLYRFDVDCKVLSWYNKIKVAQFYNSHTVEVRVNEAPDFDLQFVIPATDPTVYPHT